MIYVGCCIKMSHCKSIAKMKHLHYYINPYNPGDQDHPQHTISLMMLQRSLAFDCIVPMVRYVEQSSYRVDEVRIQVVRSSSEVWSPHNSQHSHLHALHLDSPGVRGLVQHALHRVRYRLPLRCTQ